MKNLPLHVQYTHSTVRTVQTPCCSILLLGFRFKFEIKRNQLFCCERKGDFFMTKMSTEASVSLSLTPIRTLLFKSSVTRFSLEVSE